MKAITVADMEAGVDGMTLTEIDYPHAAENDVIVRVHAAGFTTGELTWPGTWVDRAGRDRTPSVPGHELAGVIVELGYGTTGLSVGQRVFGLTDWPRNGSLAEFAAVEARNLAPLPASVDFVTAAALPISGLTSWQDEVDVVFDVIGGDVFERSLAVLRAGGRIVALTGPAPRQPENGQAIFFIVEPDRTRLADLGRRLQDGRLKPIVGAVRPLAESAAAFAPGRRVNGKTIIAVT